MHKFTNAIGIDVSKLTLDLHDHANDLRIQVDNTTVGFKKIIQWSLKNNSDFSNVFFCFEHTGLYSLPLAVFLTENQIPYAVVPGMEIKRSLGISRGKNDQVDAKRIGEYAYLRREKIDLYTLPSSNLLELKSLLTLREKMVSQRAGYLASKKEMLDFFKIVKPSSVLFEVQEKMIKELDTQIDKVEAQIKKIIDKDEHLKKTFQLITSVKGVGLVVGVSLMVYSNCFTTFKDWRKFASYCGIAPFEYVSGTSIKGKKKIHYLANKRIKSLLSNAATVSIQHNPEMKLYYQRRLKEGKNKMSTINIIRNKVLARVFAVVQRGTPYVNTLKFAA
jgi:transposase